MFTFSVVYTFINNLEMTMSNFQELSEAACCFYSSMVYKSTDHASTSKFPY